MMTASSSAAPAKSLDNGPDLLIHWSSPWQEFVTSIRPAIGRSSKPLAGEAPSKIFPFRGMVAAWIFESSLLAAIIWIPAKIASVEPYVPPVSPKYDVIYYSGDELPQTEDIGGAEKGKSGLAGGQQAQHDTQTIRVVRGSSPAEKISDAPKINLPEYDLNVANLLAIRGVPEAPPTSGLKPSIPSLPQADAVAPAPLVSREQFPASPSLAASIVEPPPAVSRDRIHALPEMTPAMIAPPPDVSRDKMRAIEATSTAVVGPPPEVMRDQMWAREAVNASVVAPAPSVQQDIAAARRPAARSMDVIPPPVSAPDRADRTESRLTLPQPEMVAPAPSNVSRELSSYSVKVGELHKQVIPPPVELGSVNRHVGPNSTALGTNVVPPPPSLSGSGSASSGTYSSRAARLASNVVLPPTSVGSRRALGSGHGETGTGRAGSRADSPNSAGETDAPNTAVIVSSQPGSRVGVPGSYGVGALTLSPSGGAKAGVGGPGNGGGLGRGNGPGSGLNGESTGAASSGAGPGSDPASRSGVSPYPGTGGAGRVPAGASSTPGISVNGGNTITLPSFGGGSGLTAAADPSRTHLNKADLGITIVASSRSGGAFNFYGVLKGDPVYAIYFETAFGTAVLQYADPASAHHVYAKELSRPEPLRADLPAGLTPARMVIACILDPTGVLRNVRVLEAGPGPISRKVLASLSGWKFKPAFRGDQPVEVNAILGFNIDTR